MCSKSEIRRMMLEKRMNMDIKEYKALSEKITEKLKSLKEFAEANVVMGYYPIKNEVDILPLLKEMFAFKTVLLPKTGKQEIVPVILKSLEDLKMGKFKIPIPKEEHEYKGKIDLILVPGLAFDLKLRRLGYGYGYYDRFLKSKEEAFKIGLAFDSQIIEEIPCEDSRLDMVITEKRILKSDTDDRGRKI